MLQGDTQLTTWTVAVTSKPTQSSRMLSLCTNIPEDQGNCILTVCRREEGSHEWKVTCVQRHT